MSDILIGPGPSCWECGGDYGQHTDECPSGKRERREAKEQAVEDAITKRDLLGRIEKLEKAVKK